MRAVPVCFDYGLVGRSRLRYNTIMPLHDWNKTSGWEGVHLFCMTELARDVKPRLPVGYRAYLGTAPFVAIGAPGGKPDVAVRRHTEPAPTDATTDAGAAPDVEVAVALLDPEPALFIERDGVLVSALELISPRNKDRPDSRETYLRRYSGYLIGGVHLMLVDVHPRPLAFSFVEQIAALMQLPEISLPPPFAAAFRVGEPAATGGRMLAVWKRRIEIGAVLPSLPLSLEVGLSVPVDLESTYMRAAADAYLV